LDRALIRIIQIVVAITMPVFLLLTAGRLTINDWYLRYEYGKPDFPRDPFGFTQQQRLELATVSIRFLQSSEPAEVAIKLLEAQRMPGMDRPLFGPDELSHMMDVKRFTDVLWRVQTGAGVLAIGGVLGLLATRRSRRAGYRALFWGGAATTGFLLALALFVLVSWRTFFVMFHELFFPPDTWMFAYSTSLIRLYPDRFWFDAGVLITLGTLGAGIILAGIGYWLSRRGPAAEG